ncbi:MAG TPA: hypothetical protein VGR00_13445 [Thermoanaerobaculia bacterium]|nr:hypothetical protein [Thermoanaerobaculia bacterium]
MSRRGYSFSFRPGLVLLTLAVTASLGAAPPSTDPTPPPTPVPLLVDYHRTGGFVGVDDRVQVTPTGAVVVTDRQGARAKGQLTQQELGALQDLFAGWEGLSASKRPTGAAPDAYVWEIQFKGKAVHVAESDGGVPPVFERARVRIEELSARVRSEAAKKK